MITFPKRNFTLSLEQEGTGKTAQIAIKQEEFQTAPIFKGPEDKNIHISYKGGEEIKVPIESYLPGPQYYSVSIPIEVSDIVPPAKEEEAIELEKCQVTKKGGRKAALFIIAKENPYYEPRQLTIRLRQTGDFASDEEMVFTVTQEGKPDDGIFSVSPTAITATADGKDQQFHVTSTFKGKEVPWSVSTPAADIPKWISVHINDTTFQPWDLLINIGPNFGYPI